MRSKMPVVIAVGVFAFAEFRSATVRGTQDQSPTATTRDSMTIRRGDSAALEVGIGRDRSAGRRSAAASSTTATTARRISSTSGSSPTGSSPR